MSDDRTIGSTRPSDPDDSAQSDADAIAPPPDAPAAPGARDDRRYQITGEHGRGGLGRVMRAHDRELERTVAIKELLRRDPVAEQRFLREALLTARLEHPGIVPIHEAGRWPDGTPFYTMKLVDGRPLRELIDDARGLDERLALIPHVAAVADAVAYAHARGIIHRDLKPSNVLVGRFGETVVIDWGLAKRVADDGEAEDAPSGDRDRDEPGLDARDLTIDGTVMGTPTFMAPEQARGTRVDERADVYALGAMLYFVLAGRPPYVGSSAEVLRAVLTIAPPAIGVVEPEVPPDLAALIGKAMARTPAERYPTARELADDLRRFMTGKLVSAHRYRAVQLVRRWAARHRAALAVAAVALALLVAGAVVGVRQVIGERDTAQQERRDAQSARRDAEARADALTLNEARRTLTEDPTRALAILADYPAGAAGWREVSAITADAVGRGIASRVLATGEELTSRVAWSSDGVYLAAVTARSFQVWRAADGVQVFERRLPDRTVAANVIALTASAEGAVFVSSHVDGELRVVDVAASTLRSLRSPAKLNSLVLDRRGETLLGAAQDGTLRVWDLVHDTARDLPAHTGGLIYALAVTPDARTLVSVGKDGRAIRWRLDGGTVTQVAVHTPGAVILRAVAISDDGRRIAAGSDKGQVWCWDEGGATATLPPVSANDDLVRDLAFSGDGAELHVSHESDQLRTWRPGTDVVRDDRGGRHMSRGDDGWLALGATDGAVVLRHVSGWSRRLIGHPTRIEDVAIAPGGDVASISREGMIRIWSVRLRPARFLAHDVEVQSMRFTADLRRVVASDVGGQTRVWDVEHGTFERLAGHDGGDRLRIFPPDGVVTGGIVHGEISVWNLDSGRSTHFAALGSSPIGLVILDDNEHLVVGTQDGRLLLADRADGTMTELKRYPTGVLALGTDPARRRVVVGTSGGDLEVYDAAARRVVHSEHLGAVESATLLEGDMLVSLDRNHALRMRSLDGDPARQRTISVPFGRRILTDGDGHRFAALSQEGVARLLTSDGTALAEVRHGSGEVAVAWGEDPALMVTGGADERIVLIDTAAGTRCTLPNGGAVWALALGAGDRTLVATSGGRYLVVWLLDDAVRPPSRAAELGPWLRQATAGSRAVLLRPAPVTPR